MRASSGAPLPGRIRAWIANKGGDHALLLLSVDAWLRPHAMMLARDEVAVVSRSRLRVAVGRASRSGENLRLRGSGTLAIFAPGLACTIKARVAAGPRTVARGTVAYDLVVEDVRFDEPAAREGAARLLSGLRFEGRRPRPALRAKMKSLS